MSTVKGTTVYGGVHHHYYTHPAPAQDELVAKQIEIIQQQAQEIEDLKKRVGELEADKEDLRFCLEEAGISLDESEDGEKDYVSEVEQPEPEEDTPEPEPLEELQEQLQQVARKRIEVKVRKGTKQEFEEIADEKAEIMASYCELLDHDSDEEDYIGELDMELPDSLQ